MDVVLENTFNYQVSFEPGSQIIKHTGLHDKALKGWLDSADQI
jgi:hypothetical protein